MGNCAHGLGITAPDGSPSVRRPQHENRPKIHKRKSRIESHPGTAGFSISDTQECSCVAGILQCRGCLISQGNDNRCRPQKPNITGTALKLEMVTALRRLLNN